MPVSDTQPRSNGFGVARPGPPDELEILNITQLTRYDLVLATIPAVLVVSWLIAQTTAVPGWAALASGVLAILPLLADGLAFNPPA